MLFYEYVGSSWTLRAQERGASGAQLGWSVAFGELGLNGLPRLAVGAPGSAGASLYALSSVLDPTSWSAVAHFTATTTPGSGAGRAVAFTEGVGGIWAALIGAPLDDTFAVGAGSLHPFSLVSPQGGVAGAALSGRWHDNGDELGAALDGEGNLWACAATGDSDEAAGSGAVYVLRRFSDDPADVAVEAKLTKGASTGGESFGADVAVDGGRIAIGADSEDTAQSLAGAVYVFEQSAGVWSQTARLEPSLVEQGRSSATRSHSRASCCSSVRRARARSPRVAVPSSCSSKVRRAGSRRPYSSRPMG